MGDNVQIVLIIAVALIVVLFVFRKQLSGFRFKGGKDGIDMELKTRKTQTPATPAQPKKNSTWTSVSGNKLWGRKNKIDVHTGNASVADNQLIGEDQELSVGPENKNGK